MHTFYTLTSFIFEKSVILGYLIPSLLLSVFCLYAVLPDIDGLLSAPGRPAPAMLLIQEHEGIARPLFSSPN